MSIADMSRGHAEVAMLLADVAMIVGHMQHASHVPAWGQYRLTCSVLKICPTHLPFLQACDGLAPKVL